MALRNKYQRRGLWKPRRGDPNLVSKYHMLLNHALLTHVSEKLDELEVVVRHASAQCRLMKRAPPWESTGVGGGGFWLGAELP